MFSATYMINPLECIRLNTDFEKEQHDLGR